MYEGPHHKNSNSNKIDEQESESDSEVQFLVTEEMMQFLEISMRHKEEMSKYPVARKDYQLTDKIAKGGGFLNSSTGPSPKSF